MGRISFVAWMYIMAGASVLIAIVDGSWGWLLGAIGAFGVADMARRKLKNDASVGPGEARIGFVGIAMLVMISAMLVLFWFQFRSK